MAEVTSRPSGALVVGLGGAGGLVCRRLVDRVTGVLPHDAEVAPAAGRGPDVLLIDTDRSVLEVPGEVGLALTASAATLDAAYRSPERFGADWLNREVLRGRRTVESGTQGSRALGRFLLLLEENRLAIRNRVLPWLRWGAARPGGSHAAETSAQVPVPRRRIFVVASTAGGTGGGQVLDLGYLLRDAALSQGVEVELRAILFVPPHTEMPLAPNSFATLTELHYFSDPLTRYRGAVGDDDALVETRLAPYERVDLLTSLTVNGEVIPLRELQERAVIYLMAATVGDAGHWRNEQAQREAQVAPVDPDGNPQVFGTFGVEWLEYPEERLISAVYRNLVRRSLYPWLQGDTPIGLGELPREVPLQDSEAMSALLTASDGGSDSPEVLLRPIQARGRWLHKAPAGQWNSMDQELETALRQTVGKPPTPEQPGSGPMAARFGSIRTAVVAGLRGQSEAWCKREGVSLERVTRILNEAATELRTHTDPVATWGEAWEATRIARRRLLFSVDKAQYDPFLFIWRRLLLRRLADEYEKVAALHVRNQLRSQSTPYLRELRSQVLECVRAWAGRIGELAGLFARLSRSMADYESALLEGLRRDEEDKRLVLGRLLLPGAETPYVANSGWSLPFCSPADENGAIRDLRQGWIEILVERPDGLLAEPGQSLLDGPVDEIREERLPWLVPLNFNPALEGTETRMREIVMKIDRQLRSRIEPRLRSWLAASAFQRLGEQFQNPMELEYQVRRLVGLCMELPAIEPLHARPQGLAPEYTVIFFGEHEGPELPPALQLVVGAVGRERAIRVVPSHSTRFLLSLSEHPGFSLARCPAFYGLQEVFNEGLRRGMDPLQFAFTRTDVPWSSATLVSRDRLRGASDVLFLALSLGLLRALPDGQIPIPAAILALQDGAHRFPLPAELDLAVRQLAGDPGALAALGTAVDRAIQSRGAEWCCLQVERVVRGLAPLGAAIPGDHPAHQTRTLRLTALRAAARYEDLLEEYSRTATSRETDWLRSARTHACAGCGHDLGADPAAIPGACPRCREILLPHKARAYQEHDGFRRIPNPYVVGTPLESGASVFVGREDIIHQVRERLIRPAQRTILILIGERRSGKTSALKQLQHRLEGDLTPLFIDMQGLTATDLPGFLWWLAWRMKEALEERGIAIHLPSFADFSSGPPDYQFETVIMPEVRRALSGGRVLLMLDEFEVLAQRVMKGTFDGRAFDYLRHLMQHGEGIEFLFAGTHVLRQFAANYVTFLFNIGVFLQVDFLTQEAALRLMQEPVQQAGVTYEPASLQALLELGGAHAYFTQMFCFHLVERLNRLRKRNITAQDVEMEARPVIAAAGAHLDHLWGQLEDPDRLLIAFFTECCPRGEWLSEPALLERAIRDDSSLRPFVFRTALEKLIAIGLLRSRSGTDADGRSVRGLSLTAEVYRQWLQTDHAYRHLREEGMSWG